MERTSSVLVHHHPASRRVRREAGASRRSDLPLEDHALLPDVEARRDPIGLLAAQDEMRLQHLVPTRHGRMSATAFTFYRGAAAVMASDLSHLSNTGLTVQLCGDAHLSNFGFFNGPDRRVVFDLNDFDETHPGPFEWDVKRLAASVAVAGRNNGLSQSKIDRAVRGSVEGYRKTLGQVSKRGPLEVHYWRLELDRVHSFIDDSQREGKGKSKGKKGVSNKDRARLEKMMKKSGRKNSLRALNKLTGIVDGRRVILADPPLIERVDELLEPEAAKELSEFFDHYLSSLPRDRRLLLDRYAIVDIAHKVVGVGSVGSRCLIVLMESGDGEPLFLQFKEATTSVLEPYLGASKFEPGERVVHGQRITQTMGDIFLGWSHIKNDQGRVLYFYFRQLWDGKGSAEVEDMGGRRLRRYARLCGGVLALAHARSGDASMISGYIGDDDTFDRAIAEFAHGYADLTEQDHAAHLDAISSGKVEAKRDLDG